MGFSLVLETRVKEVLSEKILSTVFRDWCMISNYDYNTLMRICQRPDMRATPIFKSGQLIRVSVMLEGRGRTFLLNMHQIKQKKKKELWNDLKLQQVSTIVRNKQWLIAGNFNETLNMEDHSSYVVSPMVMQGMRDFNEVTQYCLFLDFDLHGPRYILTCLFLFNEHWFATYPQSQDVFEGTGCSDHLRCDIQLQYVIHRPRRPFIQSSLFMSLFLMSHIPSLLQIHMLMRVEKPYLSLSSCLSYPRYLGGGTIPFLQMWFLWSRELHI